MSFNFENQPINFRGKSLMEDKVFVEKLLIKKHTLVDQYRPKESDFTDVYSQAEINADMDHIQQIKESWGGSDRI